VRVTPQYEGLESLYQKYQARGWRCSISVERFRRAGAGEQCRDQGFLHLTLSRDVSDVFENPRARRGAASAIRGADGAQSPKPGEVQWNFGKFLIGRDGKILARFDSDVEPDAVELTKALEEALAGK